MEVAVVHAALPAAEEAGVRIAETGTAEMTETGTRVDVTGALRTGVCVSVRVCVRLCVCTYHMKKTDGSRRDDRDRYSRGHDRSPADRCVYFCVCVCATT